MPTFDDILTSLKAMYAAVVTENTALKKTQPAPTPAPTVPAPPPSGGLTASTQPSFGPGPYTVGKSITRVSGVYPGAKPVAGRRYRDGTLIPGATTASYVIQAADIGATLVYEEEALHDTTGERKWFRSAGVKGAAAVVNPPATSDASVWSVEVAQDAIACSTGVPNEGRILNMNNGSPGWLSGNTICYGNEFRNLDRWWDWGSSGRDDYFWFEYVEWWAVLFHEEGSQGDGWVDIKDMDFQVLYKGENKWTRLQPKAQAMAWGDNYTPQGNGYSTDGGVPQTRAGTDGGQSMLVPYGKSPHFTALPRIKVPRIDQIEGVISTMLVRLDPRNTNTQFRGLVQCSADPKPTASPGTDGVQGAYVAFAISQTRRVQPQWRRITASNLARPDATHPDHPGYKRRVMSHERFMAVRPLA